MKYSKIYYWNMYAPHRIIRRSLARFIFRIAHKKYGADARGEFSVGLTQKQIYMIKKYHFWMRITHRINNRI